jgi:aminoglycoside phosphotransferase (APT) family kinase protein
VRLLQAEQTDILATFVKMDQSGVRAKALSTDWVLTHGDPNLDNLLKDGHGQLHLTDWGEIALGPPERDLFAFTGEGFEAFLRTYKRLRQHVVLHAEIFAFYFYRWTMQEIADYATRILFERRGQVEDEHAWAELQPYLPIRHDHIAQGLRELQAVLERVLG